MAQTVSADVTVTVNVSDVDTSGTMFSAGDSVSGQETVLQNYGATPLPTVGKQWSKSLTFVAATPQTFDLTALTGPRGATVTFASVRLVYLIVLTTTTAFKLTFGNPGANGWFAPFDAVTDAVGVPPGSRLLLENADVSAPWVVDATHKIIKLDPGANVVTARLLILGS